jgi:hypothetical protein
MLNGSRVRVCSISDEIGDPTHIGHHGTVEGRVVRDHGASPRDPLLLVRLDHSGELDAFWPEEVRPI